MNINIFTHEDWFEYDLNTHFIQVKDGALWVYGLDAQDRDGTVAVFAKGEWRRVDFERIQPAPFPASEDF